MQKWKRLSSKVILTHPRVEVVEDRVQLPDGNTTDYVRFDGYLSAVTIFAVRDGKVLLQREYSYPPDVIMKQIPGGAIEPGETPEEAARRELKEESGYAAATLEQIGTYYIDNRRSDARIYVYLATEISECEKVGTDPEEFIESFWVPLASLLEDIATGTITHSHLLAAWAFFEAKRQSSHS